MKYFKLIWDFKGPAAQLTAQHHLIHLNEYTTLENIETHDHGVEQLSDLHFYAFTVVEEANMPQVRDQLKPHRGKLWTPVTE